ncbi:MAG TPA: flagellar biosynthetic protein FliO [Anaerohalosphaeraceae bacterium]|nr:flagellar biosynthetic protein FliO [Anaerohalosphaeraceae bacterium]HOT71686.1 flagellar biosynthetic protein FliO [Anaerohalosphaeraceae bacterium]HPB93411.1 flagellar biosynthetic protein FliO [Anaerohalosphaeraceae bacterium]HQG04659.1 flagellar biosynthetic protein FliO [Anaerohalosphaeraceae bacterium]HQI06511.1 flagellar biosynthetic protein FliO [Anaerohalosphaeraceae bacterium]
MLKKRLIIFGLVLAFCVFGQWMLSAAHTAEPNSSQPTHPPLLEKPSSPAESSLEHLHQNLIRQLLIMIFIVALFGGGLWWFVRRYSKGLLPGKGRLITVLETVPLGPRKMLHLIEVGPKKILISSTADSIRLLTELPSTRESVSSQKERSE